MKALELFFDNEKEDSIYESWCFEPGPQDKDLGALYIIAKLEGQDSNSLDYLASSISHAYSREESLEATIELAEKKIKERGLTDLELGILTINDKKLTFTKTEGIRVALLRNKEIVNIGSKVKGNLDNIGNVELKNKDKVLAITGKAWRKFRQKHLISKIASYSKEQEIRSKLTDNDIPGVAQLIILHSGFLQKLKRYFSTFFKKIKTFSLPKKKLPKLSPPSNNSFWGEKINAAWPDRKAQKAPFLITLSYLLSFITIRLLVYIVGSVNSPIAQTVKESSSIFHFHIGRNIILFGYHIHHFYFGILLMAIAGWLAITKSPKLNNWWYAVMYGIGLGLLMDEIGLLLTWGNYTSSLSYLLGLLVLGILLNILYFPSFWKEMRGKIAKRRFNLDSLNKLWQAIIKTADKASGKE